jgi:DNA-binding transcriptional LysR family regulator
VSFKRGQLLYFVTVAEEGQITRAAAKLHLAQPALSQAITQLESELGIKLLERHPRGVTLTPAGEVFVEKARLAIAAEREALEMGKSLAHGDVGTIEVGFVGSPPMLHAPELFGEFTDAHPDAQLSFRELTLPRQPTTLWLEGVDVAFCHPPPPGLGVEVQPFRLEPRLIVAPRSHRVAQLSEVAVADVLDETFLRLHRSVDPAWAGFWSLDDHRGEQPPNRTGDSPLTSTELLACLAASEAVTTIPACHATTILNILPDVVAIPVSDADPAELALLWPADNQNPLVTSLVGFARAHHGSGAATADAAEPPARVRGA